jgi:DNA-directed RNA polymerase subunit F
VESNDSKIKPIPLAEVKNILKKASKERGELLYEQKIALEHAQKFAKLPVKKTNEMIKELASLDFLEHIHAIRIADLLPTTEDDVKTIFAKERITLGGNEIKKILEIVRKHYIE